MGMAVNSINSLQSAYTNRVNYEEQRNTSALSRGTRHSEVTAPDLARYGAYERMGSVMERRNANLQNAERMNNFALTDENLQRIRELYGRAQNTELTTGERLRIHEEIARLIQNVDNMARYSYPTAMNSNVAAGLNVADSRNHPANMDIAATSENTYRILNQYQTMMQIMSRTGEKNEVNTLI